MIFGAILAGGVGSRMGIEGMPKQYLPLGDKPVFIHTLEKFLLCGRFDAIYIGSHPDWVVYAKEEIGKYAFGSTPVRVVSGGVDRNDTIDRVISAIDCDYGIGTDDVVVTHDSVRPFVTLPIIEENIDAAVKYGACDTVIPATDTIVRSEDGSLISSIPVRSQMYQGQTPQSFKIKLFRESYGALTQSEREDLTDACKIFVMKNMPVHLVMGDPSNIKLTTLVDYRMAQALLDCGASAND